MQDAKEIKETQPTDGSKLRGEELEQWMDGVSFNDYENSNYHFPFLPEDKYTKKVINLEVRQGFHNLAIWEGWANEKQARSIYGISKLIARRLAEPGLLDDYVDNLYPAPKFLEVTASGGMLSLFLDDGLRYLSLVQDHKHHETYNKHHNSCLYRYYVSPENYVKRLKIEKPVHSAAFCWGLYNYTGTSVEVAKSIYAMSTASVMSYTLVPGQWVEENPGFALKDLNVISTQLTQREVNFSVEPFPAIKGFYLISASRYLDVCQFPQIDLGIIYRHLKNIGDV